MFDKNNPNTLSPRNVTTLNGKPNKEVKDFYNDIVCGLEYDFFTKNDYLVPRKYSHKKPYKMSIYFGIPGSYKTTMAAKLAHKSLRNGIPVFSNCPISGCYELSKENLGKFQIDHATIILDEAAVDWSNRDYKKFSSDLNYLLRYFRHYQLTIYVMSQSYNDMDITFRRLAYDFYIMKPTFPAFLHIPMGTAVRVKRKIGINEETKQIDDIYEEPKPKIIGLFVNQHVWGPRYFKYFNTYARKELPVKKDWKLW